MYIRLLLMPLAGFVLCLLFTPLVGIIADKLNILDIPRDRHIHTHATPKLGGLAIYLSLLMVTLLTQEIKAELISILGVATIYVFIGILDDARDLSPWTKLFGQLAAAIVLTVGGTVIQYVGNPFTTAIFSLGRWAALFTVVWIVSLINAMNWNDGVDGLTTGVSFISSLILAILSYQTGHPGASELALIFAGVLLGFLVYNFHPAKIFLGDSGSMLIGYLLAVFGFLGGAKIATAILVLGIPILDSIFTIIYRLLHHIPVYRGDNNHLHHRLMATGLSQVKIALIFYAASATLGIAALFFSGQQKVFTIVALVAVYAGAWIYLQRLVKHK